MNFFIDVQGTLISDLDKSVLDGAAKLIDTLNAKKLNYVIITNNTKIKSDDFLLNLRNLGLNIKDNAYIDPFCVLDSILKPCEVALFGASEFIDTMQKLGYKQDFNNPKAVLVASYDDFKFSDFATMIELVKSGAKFIAMHETSTYKKHSRLFPGVGAIAKMINYATGIGYEVVGKPSNSFYKSALELIKFQSNSDISFKEVEIFSDDAIGDLYGAKALGMQTSLVLTGKNNSKDAFINDKNIDFIYKNASEYVENICAKY